MHHLLFLDFSGCGDDSSVAEEEITNNSLSQRKDGFQPLRGHKVQHPQFNVPLLEQLRKYKPKTQPILAACKELTGFLITWYRAADRKI